MPDKTIIMPQTLLDAWLEALRSGRYAQTCHGYLQDKTGYCCLGVLEHVADGRVESDPLPTVAWLSAHNVVFKNEYGSTGKHNTLRAPCLHGDGDGTIQYASALNDNGVPFALLADAIERNAQGT